MKSPQPFLRRFHAFDPFALLIFLRGKIYMALFEVSSSFGFLHEWRRRGALIGKLKMKRLKYKEREVREGERHASVIAGKSWGPL